MISTTESYKTLIKNDFYIITPEININKDYIEVYGNNFMDADKEYSSGNNYLIDNNKLLNMINKYN